MSHRLYNYIEIQLIKEKIYQRRQEIKLIHLPVKHAKILFLCIAILSEIQTDACNRQTIFTY